MTIGWRVNSVTAHCNLVTTPDPRRILHTCTCKFIRRLKTSPENSSITRSGLSTASRLCGTAPCTTPYCWTESLLMARRFTWLCLHISRSVSILCWFICCKVVLYPYRYWHTNMCSPHSWTIASSLLLLPKTSAWSSTPEMLRSPLLGPSGTCLWADTPKPQTGIEI